jgi:regulator of sigma E protease
MAVSPSARYKVCVSLLYIVAGIMGLGLLVVVHEAGHLLAARASGMHVIRFSIGFGPPLIKYQSKRSGTHYQIAAIPFLAYVQIAGMNPFEEIDPEDKTSYANASLFARIFAILAGPLANYLFASVLFFICFMVSGVAEPTNKAQVDVLDEGAAKTAKMQSGDTIVAVGGVKVSDWEAMRQQVVKSPGKPLEFEIARGDKRLTLNITPKNDNGKGLIGVVPTSTMVPVSAKKAFVLSLERPYEVVKYSILALGRILTFQEKPDLKGPVGIVSETSKQAKAGWMPLVYFLGILSAYLGGFNALPFPALDGGRLAFLGYEAITRRKPNTRVEFMVHAFGFVMLLTLIAVVTFSDTRNLFRDGSTKTESSAPAPAKPSPAKPKGP